jgi:hypothetical protein
VFCTVWHWSGLTRSVGTPCTPSATRQLWLAALPCSVPLRAQILQYVLLRDVWAARTLARLKIDALSQPVDPPGNPKAHRNAHRDHIAARSHCGLSAATLARRTLSAPAPSVAFACRDGAAVSDPDSGARRLGGVHTAVHCGSLDRLPKL